MILVPWDIFFMAVASSAVLATRQWKNSSLSHTSPISKKKFVDQGIIFPVSASILDNITDYRLVLESYSKPLLEFIEWKETSDNNVMVVNNMKNFYRFFDVTKQAEFLFDCVEDTVVNIIPNEIKYL